MPYSSELTSCFSLTGEEGGGTVSPEVGRQVKSL